MPLIAYNINLQTDRLDVAKKIAAAVRQSSGGLRYVKAMGIALEDRGIVQVSMNLTNYEKTPIFRVFDLVRREAARYGVTVLESEIVGLVPSAALVSAAEYYLQIERFGPQQVLENKLRERLIRTSVLRWFFLAFRLARRRDPERAHLPVEIAAFDAECIRRAGDVALLRRQRAEDVFTLEELSRIVQRHLRP